MTPHIGAYLVTPSFSRFWTITGASLFYQVGMAFDTASAGGGTCEQALSWQLAVLYVTLLLNAYRPYIVAFGADQFYEHQSAERARTWGFFKRRVDADGGDGGGVRAGQRTGVSLATFVVGYPMYRRLRPARSPFTRLAVVIAAVRKPRTGRKKAYSPGSPGPLIPSRQPGLATRD